MLSKGHAEFDGAGGDKHRGMVAPVRFLFVTTMYSADGGGAHLLQELAETLVMAGHQVDLLVNDVRGEHPSGELPVRLNGMRAFNVGKLGTFLPDRGAAKYLGSGLGAVFAKRWVRWLAGRYDILIVPTPTVVSRALVARARRRQRVARMAVLVWDFFPQAHFEFGSVRGSLWGRLLYRLEARTYNESDIHFVMSPASGLFLQRYFAGGKAEQVLLPPWGNDVPPKVPGARTDDTFTAVWGGQFIARRAIDDLLAVAADAQRQSLKVCFRLAGDGPLKEHYENLVRDMELDNVVFEGRMSRADYSALLARSDLALSLLQESSTPCFPSKTVDYCRAGLPLLVSCESANDYGDIVERAGMGVAAPAGDVDALVAAFRRLVDPSSRDQLKMMAAASRQYFVSSLSTEVAANIVTDAAAGHSKLASREQSRDPLWRGEGG